MKEGSITDFELMAKDGSIRYAVEVKGWTSDTWRRALKAWALSRTAATEIDAEHRRLVKQLQNASKQLKDAAREPRGKPFLICSDKLGDAAQKRLEDFLRANSLEAQIVLIEEVDVLSTTKRLRAALNLPEQLLGEGGGAAP